MSRRCPPTETFTPNNECSGLGNPPESVKPVYEALPQPEASAPPTVWWVAPSLERLTRIPHAGVVAYRVCWFLRRVYSVRLVGLVVSAGVYGCNYPVHLCPAPATPSPPTAPPCTLPTVPPPGTLSRLSQALYPVPFLHGVPLWGWALACPAYRCQRAHYEAHQLALGVHSLGLQGLVEGLSIWYVFPVEG